MGVDGHSFEGFQMDKTKIPKHDKQPFSKYSVYSAKLKQLIIY